jgi:predicted ATPase
MKMQKIIIRNFKGIKSAEINMKQVVVIIGEQASGKSTIAKLIYFFKSLREDYIYFISDNLNQLSETESDEFQRKFWYEISRKFYRFFGAIQHLNEFDITYYFNHLQTKFIRLSIKNDNNRKRLNIDFSQQLYRTAIYDVFPYINTLRENSQQKDIFEKQNYRQSLENLQRFISDLFEDNLEPFFIPAGRNIAVNYADFFQQTFYGKLSSDLAIAKDEEDVKPQFVQDTYLMLQFLNRMRIVMDSFKGETFETLMSKKTQINHEVMNIFLRKVEQILKGKYQYNKSFGEILTIDKNDNYVHLNNASSGQQEVIRILQDVFLTLLNKDKVFRVIEEPEAHLFPMAQKHLLEVIALMLKYTDSQVIFTTHSPYILSIINNLLFADKLITKMDSNNRQIPNKEFSISSTNTEVYALVNGVSQSIIEQETGLIDQNALDTISEELSQDFDKMYNIFVGTIR